MNKTKLLSAALTAAMMFGSNGAYAAAAPNPKVTGTDVLDGSLTGADVQDSSLTGTDVLDGSLTGTDVQDNSLTGADIDESTLNGGLITGVNAATLGGQTSSALLGDLTARVAALETTVAKLNGTAPLTLSDLAGIYHGTGSQSELHTTPVLNQNGQIVNYQPHLAIYTESVILTVNQDGTFIGTNPPNCEAGTQWHGGQPAAPFVGAGCDGVFTGTVEIVGNGSTLNLWPTGGSAPIEVHTTAGGKVVTLSSANTADGSLTLLVFTKQN